MIAGLIFIIFISIVLAGIAWAVFRYFGYRPLPLKRSDAPCCPKCRYPVRGIESLSCPECGGDFREIGIATPQLMRTRMSPAVWWLLLLPFVALIVSFTALAAVVPTFYAAREQVRITWEPPTSSPQARQAVVIARGAVAVQWPWEFQTPTLVPDDIRLRAEPGSRVHEMLVDPQSHAFSYRGASGHVVQGAALQDADLDAWLADQGAQGNQRFRAEILAQLVPPTQATGTWSQGSHTFGSSTLSIEIDGRAVTEKWPPFGLIAFAFWFVVWIAGAIYLHGRARRSRQGS